MPSLIEGETRQAVKRAVPKSTNKIQAAGVARLYIAHPDKHRWTYTGLQGAAVLANDLVGNTFWLKMVDISPTNRGVIWDQEIYDTFLYNQDRIFFHTFELDECLAGLSFVDDKEAKQFKKKMDEREKNAHKNTKSNPFGNIGGQQTDGSSVEGKPHGRFGGIGRNLLHGHRHSSAPYGAPTQSPILRKDVPSPASASSPKQNDSGLDNIDATVLEELLALGLTKDQLLENADFIKSYIDQRQPQPQTSSRLQKEPPSAQPLTPQDTGNSPVSRRAPPPTPPAARTITRQDSVRPPSPSSENEPSPTRPPAQSSFRVPPPIADAGKFAHALESPTRPKATSSNPPSVPGPAPPPRPPKTPLDEEKSSGVFGVPPPFVGERKPVPPPSRNTAPPPPPTRRSGTGTGPPPPPSRDNSTAVAVSAAAISPPPLPPKTPSVPAAVSLTSLAPGRDARSVPPPPPMPSRNDVPSPPPMPTRSEAPPLPPMQSRNDAPLPPPMPSKANAPPPPSFAPVNSTGPPAPPLPPGTTSRTANVPVSSSPGENRGGLLSDIRGGAKLKKVSADEKRDRSAAVVAGGGGDGASGSTPAPAAADTGGLAGALASALAARKSKVSQSDDEDDKDDW